MTTFRLLSAAECAALDAERAETTPSVYALWAAGLARARGLPVASYRESPEDIKYCPLCKDHFLLPEDESIHGPNNLVFRVLCPVCADMYPDEYMKRKTKVEVLGDAT